jgi:hypothetical protein
VHHPKGRRKFSQYQPNQRQISIFDSMNLFSSLLPVFQTCKTIKKTDRHVTYSWDDWVPQDRVRKFTEENKELAAQLHAQMKALQQKSAPSAAKSATKKGTRANGSDFSSARGSEERHVSTAAQSGRGPRRNRDYDLENVSN